MEIKPLVASVLGKATDEHWGQVLQMPGAYGLIEIDDPSGGARERGISCLAWLSEKVSTGNLNLVEIEAIAEELKNEPVETLILLIPLHTTIHVVLRGKGGVYLKRADAFSVLLSGQGAVSGDVKEKDTLILASRAFTEAVDVHELTRAFDHLGPQEVSEQLTLILNERTGGDGAAAMVFGVEMPAGNNGPVETNLPSHRTEIFRSILRKFWKFPQQIAKNARAYAIFVLFALFALSVFFGVRKQVGVQKNKEIAEKLTAIEHSYDEGAALLELNTLKGRERLVSAKTELGVLLSQTTDRTKEGRRVRALLAEVESAITQAMQIYHGEPSVFYDIHLLKPGGEITDISLSGDALGILDRTTGTVFQILLSSKNAQVIAGGASFMGSTLLSSQTDTAYVGVTRGISRIKTTSPTQVPVIPSNEEWGSITDMVSFGGNLYLLDTQKSRIWKYVATADGFSDRREYLNPDTLPDLSKGTTLSIDGTVWISTRDGKILRFIQGQESTFLVQGVEPPLGTDLLLFTDDVSTNLYVYDPLVRRIVVLDKDGVYLAQYRWDEPLNVSSFVVSEAQKKLYLASGSTIYVLDVK